MANFNLNATVQGLGTTTIVAPTTDTYVVTGTLTLPSIPAGSATSSSVVVTVNLNGSPVYTGAAGSRGFRTGVTATAADTITIVLSSAAAVDLQPNAVKMTLSMYEGAE